MGENLRAGIWKAREYSNPRAKGKRLAHRSSRAEGEAIHTVARRGRIASLRSQ
jgi:hypothetical protein